MTKVFQIEKVVRDCSRGFFTRLPAVRLNAAAQEPDSVLSAKASKSTRQKTSVLASEKQDTVVFRFAPKRRMFWADYKGNAAAINSLTQSIRQHKLSIESGDMKVRMLGFAPLTILSRQTLQLPKIEAIRSSLIYRS